MKDILEGWETITAASYPRIHDAFETISHDKGHKTFAVPSEWAEHLDKVEAALATLSDAEFRTFCVGDVEGMTRIAARTPQLILSHALLESFFMDWQKITK
jgi:hypothetical protein